MDIHTAAHYLKSGYRVRRSAWTNKNRYIRQMNGVLLAGNQTHEPEWQCHFVLEELLATDWEINFNRIIDDSGAEVLYKEPPSDEEE